MAQGKRAGADQVGSAQAGLGRGRSLKTTGTGSYRTPLFTVARTGTFVVQYDSDDWYYGGFTSTVKVTVR